MERPSMTLPPVFEWEYKARTENIVIYQYAELSSNYEGDCYCDKEKCKGQCFLKEQNNGYKWQPPTPNIPLSKISLQSLIDMLPVGVTPADVKITISSDDWSGVPYQKVSFSYKKKFLKDMKKFKQDKAAYDAEYAEYEKKKLAYDQWVKNQEIKKLEKDLSKLRK